MVDSYTHITSTDIKIKRELVAPNEGPYRVNEIFTNNTVKLQRSPIKEIINIRWLIPFL